MKKGACTGSISHMDTLFRLSPAVDSSHPTCSSSNNVIPRSFIGYHPKKNAEARTHKGLWIEQWT